MSFVLNDVNGGIPEETKDRVRKAARELSYRPNATAKLLRTSRSHTIGFITDEIASTPFAGNIIKGAQDSAWSKDKILMIVNTGKNQKIMDSAIEMMLERQVEGIIYAAWSHQAVSPSAKLREVPAVLVDCYSTDRRWPSVVPDEVAGGRTATEALIDKGHQRIGFINLHLGLPATSGRLEGYKQALAEHGLDYEESLAPYSDGTANGGYRRALELVQISDPPTAIFCGTDRIAMGAYDALKESGLRIPEDIAVVGFDNQEIIASYLRPPLSTVALPHYEMGQWAASYLVDLIEDPDIEPAQHTIGCPYVEREST